MTAPVEDFAEGADEPSLALDMIEVHGAAAAVIARENARIEALAGRTPQAKSWMRVLEIIQRRQTAQRAGGSLLEKFPAQFKTDFEALDRRIPNETSML